MDRCSGRCNITVILLKRALNTIQSKIVKDLHNDRNHQNELIHTIPITHLMPQPWDAECITINGLFD